MHRPRLTRFKVISVQKLAAVKGAENINVVSYEARFLKGCVIARVIQWPITKVECHTDYTPNSFFLHVLGKKHEYSGAIHEREHEVIEHVKQQIVENIDVESILPPLDVIDN